MNIFGFLKSLLSVLRDISKTQEKRLVVEQKILDALTEDLRAIGFRFILNHREISMLQLTDVQSCSLSVQPIDAKGNPAPVDGPPSWSVSDPTILSIVPSADGLSASISAVGLLGNCQVNVSADADMGAGTVTISGSLDVTVVASQAASLNIGAGVPA
jgi:hypothetical protein